MSAFVNQGSCRKALVKQICRRETVEDEIRDKEGSEIDGEIAVVGARRSDSSGSSSYSSSAVVV